MFLHLRNGDSFDMNCCFPKEKTAVSPQENTVFCRRKQYFTPLTTQDDDMLLTCCHSITYLPHISPVSSTKVTTCLYCAYLPALNRKIVNFLGLCREIQAYFEELAGIVFEGGCIAFQFYLF